jgi:peroxisome-assembly ATPase
MNITVTVAAVARRGSVLTLSARAHQQRRCVSSNSPLSHYDRLVNSGALRAGDEHQHRVVRLLDELHQQLQSYDPPEIPPQSPSPKSSIFSRLFSKGSAAEPAVKVDDAPQGLYLHGSVGTGKTMLMDLFYNTLPSKWDSSKRRAHFHAFMVDVHKRVHAVNIKSDYNGGDQVGIVARDIARKARVLCFDEFQVCIYVLCINFVFQYWYITQK